MKTRLVSLWRGKDCCSSCPVMPSSMLCYSMKVLTKYYGDARDLLLNFLAQNHEANRLLVFINFTVSRHFGIATVNGLKSLIIHLKRWRFIFSTTEKFHPQVWTQDRWVNVCRTTHAKNVHSSTIHKLWPGNRLYAPKTMCRTLHDTMWGEKSIPKSLQIMWNNRWLFYKSLLFY